MDGVLVRSEEKRLEFARNGLEDELGVSFGDEEMALLKGRRFQDFLSDVLQMRSIQISAAVFDFLERRFDRAFAEEITRSAVLIDDSWTMLRDAKQAGYLVALVTGSTRRQAMSVLHMADVASFFDVTVTSEVYRNGKPAPDPYETARRILSIGSRECVGLEDSSAGLQSLLRFDAGAILHLDPKNEVKTPEASMEIQKVSSLFLREVYDLLGLEWFDPKRAAEELRKKRGMVSRRRSTPPSSTKNAREESGHFHRKNL